MTKRIETDWIPVRTVWTGWARIVSAPWTGDNWIWCGGCQKRGECPIVTCTNHRGAPR